MTHQWFNESECVWRLHFCESSDTLSKPKKTLVRNVLHLHALVLTKSSCNQWWKHFFPACSQQIVGQLRPSSWPHLHGSYSQHLPAEDWGVGNSVAWRIYKNGRCIVLRKWLQNSCEHRVAAFPFERGSWQREAWCSPGDITATCQHHHLVWSLLHWAVKTTTQVEFWCLAWRLVPLSHHWWTMTDCQGRVNIYSVVHHFKQAQGFIYR